MAGCLSVRHKAVNNNVDNYPVEQAQLDEMRAAEHDCDAYVKKIMVELADSFITPFDREDIAALAHNLDDIVDALIGGLIGATIVFTGRSLAVQWDGLVDKVVIPLFTSPLIGMALGAPVSTTQMIMTSIMGADSARNAREVRWGTARLRRSRSKRHRKRNQGNEDADQALPSKYAGGHGLRPRLLRRNGSCGVRFVPPLEEQAHSSTEHGSRGQIKRQVHTEAQGHNGKSCQRHDASRYKADDKGRDMGYAACHGGDVCRLHRDEQAVGPECLGSVDLMHADDQK